MIYISEKSDRPTLLNAIYSQWELLDRFIKAGKDPENMSDRELLTEIEDWTAEGDECAESH